MRRISYSVCILYSFHMTLLALTGLSFVNVIAVSCAFYTIYAVHVAYVSFWFVPCLNVVQLFAIHLPVVPNRKLDLLWNSPGPPDPPDSLSISSPAAPTPRNYRWTSHLSPYYFYFTSTDSNHASRQLCLLRETTKRIGSSSVWKI